VRRLVALLAERLPPAGSLAVAYLHVCGAQATLIAKAREGEAAVLGAVVAGLPETGIEGLWLHLHPAAGRRLFSRSGWLHVWGEARSRDADGLTHGPTAFVQALPELHRATLAEARGYLRPGAGVAVLDLYSGLGASLREWRRAGSAALGVEISGEAVELAAVNAPGASILRGTCVQRLPQIRTWWRAQDGARVAYVNPPRSGLETAVSEAIASELRPTRLAYLSCSAGTLARDLALLEEAGYRTVTVRPYDFFPLTHHVEALALVELQAQPTPGSHRCAGVGCNGSG
jgi:hypothetical protein